MVAGNEEAGGRMRVTWKVKQNLEMGRLDGRKFPGSLACGGEGAGMNRFGERDWESGCGYSKQSVTGKWAGMWSSRAEVCLQWSRLSAEESML